VLLPFAPSKIASQEITTNPAIWRGFLLGSLKWL